MPTSYRAAMGSWAGRTTFFWAATGATVGLGNLWQFPYMASQHGGGLFILLYLACLLLITLPLMITEATFGRHARHGLVLAMDGYIRAAGRSRLWMWTGRLSIVAALLVFAMTAVVGAICLAFVFFAAFGRFAGADEPAASRLLAELVSEPRNYRLFMAWHGAFLLLVVWVSVQGVVNGLERALRVVVPVTFLLMFALLLAGAMTGGFADSVEVLLSPQPGRLSLQSLGQALLQAFYTLGVGMGVWAVFGAYTPAGTPLKRSVLAVVLVDTLMAIVAGLMLLSLLGGQELSTGEQGFRLLFVTLPAGLAQWPGSQFLGVAVFLLVVMLIWSTSLALLEPVVGWFREWTGAPREWSVLFIALLAWLIGTLALLSFNLWSGATLAGGSGFQWLDLLASGVLIPTVSIMLALFAGWGLTGALVSRVLGHTPRPLRSLWLWTMRLLLPGLVAAIGVYYSYVSLQGMCDGRAEDYLCGAPRSERSVREGSGAPPEPPVRALDKAGERPEKPVKETSEAPRVPPKEDNIVYDSV